MKSIILVTLFAASSAFANQFASFVGTYVPVGKSVDQSFGRADCATYGFSTLTEFKIYETSGALSYSKKGNMDHGGSLVEYANRGQRFQKEIYITGTATQAVRQEYFSDWLHNDFTSSALSITQLSNGNYLLKYVSHFSNEMDNLYAACSSEIEVARK